MPDYKSMYTLLCKAVDDAIDPLSEIPEAAPVAQALIIALNAAEEIFISSFNSD